MIKNKDIFKDTILTLEFFKKLLKSLKIIFILISKSKTKEQFSQ